MIYLSDLQKETLMLVDNMINANKTFKEITDYLYNNGYIFSVETKNGYTSKTKFSIYKQEHVEYEYTFVDLIKRKNGLAYWETIKLS